MNHSKAGSRKYKLANRTLYFLLANLSALNPKNDSTWEKNACSLPWLPSKGSGGLIFRGLTITDATTNNSCGAAGA